MERFAKIAKRNIVWKRQDTYTFGKTRTKSDM